MVLNRVVDIDRLSSFVDMNLADVVKYIDLWSWFYLCSYHYWSIRVCDKIVWLSVRTIVQEEEDSGESCWPIAQQNNRIWSARFDVERVIKGGHVFPPQCSGDHFIKVLEISYTKIFRVECNIPLPLSARKIFVQGIFETFTVRAKNYEFYSKL